MNSKTILYVVTCLLFILILVTSTKADLNLNTWTENLIADDTAGIGFVIDSPTMTTTQSGGLTRAILFSGTNDRNFMLEGSVKVDTTFDDDFLGFVVGYNNNDYSSASANYILIDWKQANQDFDFGSGSGIGYRGLALSTVTDSVAGANPGNDYAWQHTGPVTEQLRANTLGTTGWTDNQSYDFRLVYTPGRVQFFIDGLLELDYTGTLSYGSLGLYQFSQRDIEFSNLSMSVIPAPPAVILGILGLGTVGWKFRKKSKKQPPDFF